MFKSSNYKLFNYDLHIRYSNISLTTIFYIYNKEYTDKNLPIYDNFHLDPFNEWSRKIQLFIGDKKNSKLFSFFGQNIIFLKNNLDNNFFSKTDYFLDITNYNICNMYNPLIKKLLIIRNVKLFNGYLNILNLPTSDNYNDSVNDFFDIIDDFDEEDEEDDELNNLIFFKKQIDIKERQIYFIKLYRWYYNLFFKHRIKKLKKKFYKLKKKNLKKKFSYYELTLFTILINIFNLNRYDIVWLIKNNYVYINNIKCNNLYYILKKNDLIQLKINKNFYLLNRFTINFIIRHNTRILAYYDIFMKKNTLKFSKKNFFYFLSNFYDIFKFLEVDYVSLSIFILYTPISGVDYNFLNLNYKSVFRLNYLNWKIFY